jgi:signal recognition particle receptor subunit beta
MVQFNFFRREVNCKIVYYGPGLSGKTTNLEMVHKKTPSTNRGELTSIATEQDRTLFFDFMPIDLGTVAGMKTKLRLFTVPGQIFYNSTRKLVLQGADGVIFVADSQKHKMDENLESLKNLEENLREHSMDIRAIPLVIQWNKRDMPTALSVAELERQVNYLHAPTYEAVAVTGEGVFPTLKKCAALVLESVTKGFSSEAQQKAPAAPFKPKPAVSTATPAAPPVSAAHRAGEAPRPQQPLKAAVSRGAGMPQGAASAQPLFTKFKKFGEKDTKPS